MGDLNRDMRGLLDRVCGLDDPPPDARERVRRTLASTLAKAGALGVGAAGLATAPSATAAAAGASSTLGVSASALNAAGISSAAASATASAATATTAAAVVVAKTSGLLLAINLTVAALAGAAVGTGAAVFVVRGSPPRQHPAAIFAPGGPIGTEKRETPTKESPPLGPLVPEAHAPAPVWVVPEPLDTPRPTAPSNAVRPSASRTGLPAAGPPRAATLIAETRLLADAQVALRTGRAQRSLELIESHENVYPWGTLREERMATKILVLCALERVHEARDQARRFEADFPRSPLLPRIQQSCVGLGAE